MAHQRRSSTTDTSTSSASSNTTPAGPGNAWKAAAVGAVKPVPFRNEMEALFGEDFGDVQVRTGAGDGLRDSGMEAAAVEDRIVFADASPSREQVAHELTHVVQHGAGGGAGGVSRPGDASEREAEAAGRAAAKGEPIQVEEAGGGLHAGWLDGIGQAVRGAWETVKDGARAAWGGAQRVWGWLTGSGASSNAPQSAAPEGTPGVQQAPQPEQTPQPEQAQPAAQGPIVQEQLDAQVAAVLAQVPESMREAAGTALPAILRQAALAGVTDPNQVAYILATAQHESRFGTPLYERSQPLVEDRNPFRTQADGSMSARVHTNGRTVNAPDAEQLETSYWDSAYGNILGNRPGTTDGRDFRGRGYVQITGRSNYEGMSGRLNNAGFSYTVDGVSYGGPGNPPIDLAAHPDHVNRVPDLAARIMVTGMTQGGFTGRSLDDYVTGENPDFTNARRIVNGDVATNGESIANLARTYAGTLRGSWAQVFRQP